MVGIAKLVGNGKSYPSDEHMQKRPRFSGCECKKGNRHGEETGDRHEVK
jgi:hypothetical protein